MPWQTPELSRCNTVVSYYRSLSCYRVIGLDLNAWSSLLSWIRIMLGYNPEDWDPGHVNGLSENPCAWDEALFHFLSSKGHALVWPWNQRLTFGRRQVRVLGRVCISGKVKMINCPGTWPCFHELTPHLPEFSYWCQDQFSYLVYIICSVIFF